MPTSNFARINLDQLHAPFLETALNVIASCNAQGANYVATLGYRTFQEQAKLYFQGRTAPGRIVTNAGPGDSAHNYGIAIDFARIENGRYLQRAEDYALLGAEAEKAGLVWGGRFKGLLDCPHIQMAGYVTAADMAPLKSVYLAHQEAPLSAVFDFFNNKGVA